MSFPIACQPAPSARIRVATVRTRSRIAGEYLRPVPPPIVASAFRSRKISFLIRLCSGAKGPMLAHDALVVRTGYGEAIRSIKVCAAVMKATNTLSADAAFFTARAANRS